METTNAERLEAVAAQLDALYTDIMEALAKQNEQIQELLDMCDQAQERFAEMQEDLGKLADNRNYE